MKPTDMVVCSPWTGEDAERRGNLTRLMAQACAKRHLSVWETGNRHGDKRYEICGTCSVGRRRAELLKASGWKAPTRWPSGYPTKTMAEAKARHRLTLLPRWNEP